MLKKAEKKKGKIKNRGEYSAGYQIQLRDKEPYRCSSSVNWLVQTTRKYKME